MYYNNYNYNNASNGLFGYNSQQHGAIQRYLRMQEQEKREAAFVRRRRRELLERRKRFDRSRQMALTAALEEEERRRERQHLKEQQHALSYGNDDDDSDDYESDYEINVVRGRDGSLYYVKTPVNTQRRERQERRPTIAEEPIASDSDSIQSDVEEDDVAEAIRRLRPRFVAATTPLARERHPARSPRRKKSNNTSQRKNSPRRSRITVVTVEDASDSEYENEFDSPWRNRLPSPGEWMEPVESYLE